MDVELSSSKQFVHDCLEYLQALIETYDGLNKDVLAEIELAENDLLCAQKAYYELTALRRMYAQSF